LKEGYDEIRNVFRDIAEAANEGSLAKAEAKSLAKKFEKYKKNTHTRTYKDRGRQIYKSSLRDINFYFGYLSSGHFVERRAENVKSENCVRKTESEISVSKVRLSCMNFNGDKRGCEEEKK
jgi:hypothetical protein